MGFLLRNVGVWVGCLLVVLVLALSACAHTNCRGGAFGGGGGAQHALVARVGFVVSIVVLVRIALFDHFAQTKFLLAHFV